MTVLQDLTSFQRDLLVVVAAVDEPVGHGDLSDRLAGVYDERIRPTRVSQNLSTLEGRGMITGEAVENSGRAYSLTPFAREALDDYRDWVGTSLR